MPHNNFTIVLLALLSAGTSVLAADPTVYGPRDVTVFVDENAPIGKVIYDVDAVDKDNHAIVYTFFNAGPGKFTINPDYGIISVFGPLDFVDKKRYIFTVSVEHVDKNNGVNGMLVGFVVNIRPMNRNAPKFIPTILTVSINESSQQDSVVAVLTCTDTDTGPNPGCTTISIVTGDDPTPKFKVINNQILTTSSPVDYDVMASQNFLYKLVVIATDTPSTGTQRTGTTTILVNVLPVNEYDPYIHGQPISQAISEDTQVGTEVLTVTASDNDAGTHGELTYQITVRIYS